MAAKSWQSGCCSSRGSEGGAARPDGKPSDGEADSESVRMTIELSWGITGKAVDGSSQAANPGVELQVSEGRVVEAVSWPPGPRGETVVPTGWGPSESRGWRLGVANEGRVRARIEAPLNAKLIVRGGDQVVSVPVAAVLDRPQRTPMPAALTVGVERLAWDSLTLSLGGASLRGVCRSGRRCAGLPGLQPPLAGGDRGLRSLLGRPQAGARRRAGGAAGRPGSSPDESPGAAGQGPESSAPCASRAATSSRYRRAGSRLSERARAWAG